MASFDSLSSTQSCPSMLHLGSFESRCIGSIQLSRPLSLSPKSGTAQHSILSSMEAAPQSRQVEEDSMVEIPSSLRFLFGSQASMKFSVFLQDLKKRDSLGEMPLYFVVESETLRSAFIKFFNGLSEGLRSDLASTCNEILLMENDNKEAFVHWMMLSGKRVSGFFHWLHDLPEEFQDNLFSTFIQGLMKKDYSEKNPMHWMMFNLDPAGIIKVFSNFFGKLPRENRNDLFSALAEALMRRDNSGETPIHLLMKDCKIIEDFFIFFETLEKEFRPALFSIFIQSFEIQADSGKTPLHLLVEDQGRMDAFYKFFDILPGAHAFKQDLDSALDRVSRR